MKNHENNEANVIDQIDTILENKERRSTHKLGEKNSNRDWGSNKSRTAIKNQHSVIGNGKAFNPYQK